MTIRSWWQEKGDIILLLMASSNQPDFSWEQMWKQVWMTVRFPTKALNFLKRDLLKALKVRATFTSIIIGDWTHKLMMAIISHDSKAKGCFYVLVSLWKKMCASCTTYHENKASNWIIEDVDSEKLSLAIKIKCTVK